MSTAVGGRVPLEEAKALAHEVIELLHDVEDRIDIAGSIRRLKETVGDIELVCKPAFGWAHWDDEKGEGTGWTNRHLERVHQLLGNGTFTRREGVGVGEKYQGLIYKGTALDLFCVLPPAQWGVIFAMRTGPHTYNKRVFVQACNGGLLPAHMRVSQGALYIKGVVANTPEEKDYFDLTGLPYRRPEGRS